jgi:ABC-type Fe3+-hydroxamate transport system substrate-binding protein
MRLLASTLLLFSVACSEPQAPPLEGDAFYQEEGPDGAALLLRERPVRIIPTSSSTADIVLALVDSERIAGLPETVRSYSYEVKLNGLPVELPIFNNYSGESLLALSPDLVIGHIYQDLGTTMVLRNAGIPVYSMRYPKSVEDVIADVESISSLLGERERGEALAHNLRARRDTLRADLRRSKLRTLTYTNLGSGVWTAGAGSSVDLLIKLAGMQNAGAEGDRDMDYQIDTEALVVLDPDIILVAGSVSGLTPSLNFLLEDKGLSGLKAVRNEHIVVLPSALFSCNSQHLLTAAERLRDSVEALPAAQY